jgi:peroxiredoxin (alkyl hydroperoxide reductase subunit C)
LLRGVQSINSVTYIRARLSSPLLCSALLCCTATSIEFSDMQEEFAKEDCVLLGASVDSEYSHLAWMELDRKKGGIGQINCPLIADLKRNISRDYGVMLENEGHTLRAVFIISDKGIIRHISMNDPPVGRNVAEVLRLVKAFKYTDQFGVGCPAGWQKKGDKTIKTDPKGSLDYFKDVPAKK